MKGLLIIILCYCTVNPANAAVKEEIDSLKLNIAQSRPGIDMVDDLRFWWLERRYGSGWWHLPRSNSPL